MFELRPSKYLNLTASATAVKNKPGVLRGMYVNSTNAGTIKFFDSATQSGTVIGGTITPAVGYHNLGGIGFSNLSVTIGGTALDVTLHYD